MFYYYVWVRSNRYHGREPLTYTYGKKLMPGTIVQVELQNTLVLGFISGISLKPKFKTKPITQVLDLTPLPSSSLRLAKWLSDYYPAPLGLIAQQFLPANLVPTENISQGKLDQPKLIKDPKLTAEQSKAIKLMSEPNHYMLHGITGSGKTRVYIELALKCVADNKSAIILTPEISLTTQLGDSFKSVFGNRVIIVHSQQTPKERMAFWLKCLNSSEPLIVIGPRSALFSPLKNLGLIVLDESHETAYKQEQSPQYITSRVASYLANITKSKLVLGSATPLVSEYYLFLEKNRPVINMTSLALPGQIHKKDIVVIDKKDNGLFSSSQILSQPLIDAMSVSLKNGDQILLYLNRRGTARIILCENCGWQALCPHCDIALTYHGDSHSLICHSCNYKAEAPTSCPNCGYNNIIYKTAGTKAVADEVKKFFPNVSIGRFDTDNLKSESFTSNYKNIKDGHIDVIIGTQMIAKGLDLPNLSLVGVVLADTNLYLSDYTSEERTFQLINQVIGRIGRGHSKGRAIIQTYSPDHSAIKFAINSDYLGFYNDEIKSRKKYYFPPFCYLLKLTIRRASIASTERSTLELKKQIENSYHVNVEGPSPAFHEKLNNKFQWQLVVKAAQRDELIKIINNLPANISYDLDPMDLL